MDIIPKTRMSLDIHIKPARFNDILDDLELFSLKDLVRMSDLLGVKLIDLITLVINELQIKNKARKNS